MRLQSKTKNSNMGVANQSELQKANPGHRREHFLRAVWLNPVPSLKLVSVKKENFFWISGALSKGTSTSSGAGKIVVLLPLYSRDSLHSFSLFLSLHHSHLRTPCPSDGVFLLETRLLLFPAESSRERGRPSSRPSSHSPDYCKLPRPTAHGIQSWIWWRATKTKISCFLPPLLLRLESSEIPD